MKCNHPSVTAEQQLLRALEILKNGGVVAYPTDTVYGLGADARNEKAVARIYSVKERPLSQPLPLLLADISDLAQVAQEIPPPAIALVERWWPGGLTLILRKTSCVPTWITAGSDKVAVRVPDHPVPRALARMLRVPLVGTSANLSGRPPSTNCEEIRRQLGDRVDLIIEWEESATRAIESTIVDVTQEFPVILREGVVSRREIETVWRQNMR